MVGATLRCRQADRSPSLIGVGASAPYFHDDIAELVAFETL
jgi:hypothetical protein